MLDAGSSPFCANVHGSQGKLLPLSRWGPVPPSLRPSFCLPPLCPTACCPERLRKCPWLPQGACTHSWPNGPMRHFHFISRLWAPSMWGPAWAGWLRVLPCHLPPVRPQPGPGPVRATVSSRVEWGDGPPPTGSRRQQSQQCELTVQRERCEGRWYGRACPPASCSPPRGRCWLVELLRPRPSQSARPRLNA